MGITKQLEYVRNNNDVLTKRYNGKYVVISEQLEESSFDSLDEAYTFGTKKFGLGNFLLQLFGNRVSQVYIINQTIITV